MPIIKSAKKKLRKDRNREIHNSGIERKIKEVLKNVRKSPSLDNLKQAFSALDKAAKTHIFHKNKTSRLKSNLAKLVSTGKPAQTTTKKSSKKSSKKTK